MLNLFVNQSKRAVCFILLILLLFTLITIEDLKVYADNINFSQIAVTNNYREYQENTIVGNSLGNMTAYDVYVIEKEGADTSKWERNSTNLKAETIDLINTNRTGTGIETKYIAQSYLAAKEYGETASAEGLLQEIINTQNRTTGAFGFYDIYNNMPVYDMLGKVNDLAELDVDACRTYVMTEQNVEVAIDSDLYGAWGAAQWYQVGESWLLGDWGPDFISSVEGVRVLDYLYDITPSVEIANRRNIGLNWLLDKQLEDGSFLASAWDDPVTNTAEMIIILDQLGQRGSEEWNKAIDYLSSYALNSNGEFGSYGGIGNNTLIIEAYRVINDAPLSAGTLIEMVVSPAAIVLSVNDTFLFDVSVYRFASGLSNIDANIINWTISSNGNVASINSNGEITANANGTAIVTAEFYNIEKQIEVTVEGGNSGAINQPTYVTITIYVSGIDDEILYSDVLVLTKDEEAITVLDALTRTNLNYERRGTYIYEIDGLKEKSQGALSGWKYKVNNIIANQSSDDYYLENNDVVIWFFAVGPSDEGPTLGSLIRQEIDKKIEKPVQVNIDTAQFEDEEALLNEINKNGEAVIIVKEDRNGAVYLSGNTLSSLAEKNMPLIIKNGDTLVNIASNSITKEFIDKALGDNKGSVELKANILSDELKKELLNKVDTDIMEKFTDVGGEILEIGSRIVFSDDEGSIIKEEKIDRYFEPVMVTMNVPESLSEEEIKRLTGIRYEKDEKGNVIPVKVGGIFDGNSKTITFYAEKGGSYGVMRADTLTKINLQIDAPQVKVGEEQRDIDVPPMIINSRTMVPVRFISETLGANVDWVEETKTVVITLKDEVIELVIGETSEGMDTPSIIMNDRTLVPVRYISEKYGANVLWVPSSRMVQIVQ